MSESSISAFHISRDENSGPGPGPDTKCETSLGTVPDAIIRVCRDITHPSGLFNRLAQVQFLCGRQGKIGSWTVHIRTQVRLVVTDLLGVSWPSIAHLPLVIPCVFHVDVHAGGKITTDFNDKTVSADTYFRITSHGSRT
jgi:hypothetical protein